MNPFAATSWVWKAFHRRSVTFAALFAFALVGVSLLHALRVVLGALDVGWFGLLVIPFVVVSVLARKERDWIPDEAKRRRWSQILVFGSMILATIYAAFRPTPSRPAGEPSLRVTRPHGPPGK